MTNDLRTRAEAFLATNPEETPTVPTADARRLVQELQVHQVELQMQNEELREAQTELAHSRDSYAELYDFAPVGYLTLDRNGLIQEANHTAATMLGVERGHLLGRKFADFVQRAAQDEWFRHRRQVLASDEKQTTELPLSRTDGTPFTARLECRPRPGGTDKAWRSLMVLSDITERVQAEETLRESEEKLALAASGTRIGIFDRDIATGEIAATEQNVRLLGLRATTTTTTTTTTLSQHYHYRDWAGRVHPEDLPRVEAEMDRCMALRAPFESEYRIVWPDGSLHWVAVRGVFLYSPSVEAENVIGHSSLGKKANSRSPSPVRLLGILMDITERKRIEEALSHLNAELERRVEKRTAELAESEARFRTIFDASRDGVFLRQPSANRFHLANKACLDMLGYTLEEFRAIKLEDLHFREDLPFIRHEIARFARGETAPRAEVRFRRKDRSFFFAEVSPTAMRLKGKDYVLVAIRDVSERKRLEMEVQTVSENERQRIGHDLHDGLGQSLTGIRYQLSAVQTKLARKGIPEAKELAGAVGHLQRAMRETHDMARGLFPTEFGAAGIVSALQELATSTSDLFAVRCRFDGPNQVSIADKDILHHLYRIAQEAVHNAVKHAHGKRIWICLRQNRRGTVVSVRDNGVGIPKRAPKRTGMGLQIMQYRANIIGATLAVESARGKGTTVTCTLEKKKVGG